MNSRIGFIAVLALILLFLLNSMIFVVDQRQFGVVYEFGGIKKVIDQPGLHFKLPYRNVNYLDKRRLTLTSQDTEPMFTAEKQRVVVDWYVRWRIVDPQTFIRNVSDTGGEKGGANLLSGVVRSAFQESVNKRTVRDLISTRREALMEDVQNEVRAVVSGQKSVGKDNAKPWGIEIVDVRIVRVDYVKEITESVFRRMEAERKRVANELRSTGMAEGEKIRADADRQREVIIANAYRDAQKIKGEGDGQAAATYAETFGRDPQFAQFYRSLEAYKQSFGKKGDVIVLDPSSSDFFRAMRGSGGAAAAHR